MHHAEASDSGRKAGRFPVAQLFEVGEGNPAVGVRRVLTKESRGTSSAAV
jgi:hypothetical protein